MEVKNHNAWHLCRNRGEQVECVAEAMRRLGEGCTDTDIQNALGITRKHLLSVVDDARALATARSMRHVRVSVPSSRAA